MKSNEFFKKWIPILLLAIFLSTIYWLRPAYQEEVRKDAEGIMIKLPEPETKSQISLEYTLQTRRSVRDFLNKELDLKQIGQLLWSAQGITDPKNGFRTAPSAGALYPLEIFVVKKDGCFQYIPQGHSMKKVADGDRREALMNAALGQRCIKEAPVSIVFCAVYARAEWKYRDRARQYVHIEVGHSSENLHLQAVALGLGSVSIGAFYEEKVKKALSLEKDMEPILIVPVGYPRY